MTDDAETPDEYLHLLDSPDEAIRASAAAALHGMAHPEALNACLKTLNDDADKLHADYTPSVHCLIEIGLIALMPLTDSLLAADEMTRLRAQRAVEGITQNIWIQKVSDKEIAEEEWRSWWTSLGYRYDQNDIHQRERGVLSLRNWIRKQQYTVSKSGGGQGARARHRSR